jgi:membrane-associated protease RseP (regulator of RpoE activity)
MILWFLVNLYLCILLHELSHFTIAKLVKCKVIELGIGFGKKLFQFKYKNTIYRFNWIPFGGYNKLQNELSYSRSKYAFTNLPYSHKLAIALAGCFTNCLTGVFILLLGHFFDIPLLIFMGFFSLLLGISNLIPFPALDGSYPILVWLEKIYGKKKGYKIMNKLVTKGYSILTELNKISIIVLVVLFRIQIIQYLIYYLYYVITFLNKIKEIL